MALSNQDIRNIQVAAKIKEIKASQSESVSGKGGVTVERQLLDALVNDHPLHGIHRKCRQERMGSSVLDIARVVSNVSIEGIDENTLSRSFNSDNPPVQTGTSGTEVTRSNSSLSLARISLEAKKLAARVLVSNELLEDWKAGSLPVELLRDVSAQMSIAVDGSLFGDNSLFGGDIKGNTSIADNNVADVASLALSDLTAAKIAAGRIAGEQPEWYLSPSLYDGHITDLLNAAGLPECYTEDGRPRLLGLPVNLCSGISGIPSR